MTCGPAPVPDLGRIYQGGTMERQVINPWKYQSAYGYVQANVLVGAERWLVCAGQASVDDEGQLVPGDMVAQLNRSLENLETILQQADFTMADVVRMTYYTTDMDAGLAAMEAAAPSQAEKGCRYACAMVEVARLAYPELLIELEATAVK
jgi:enamine deaminase RidA (YjgF/YER057c/UK114 family)